MSYSIGGYRVDLMTVTPSYDSDVAGDALETGARYTDHVQRLPGSLRAEGVVSDHPIGALVAVREAERAGGVQADYRPSAYARTRLLALVGTGPITVTVPEATYERYVLKSLELDASRYALRFTAQLVELVTVSLERELVEVVRVPTSTGKKNLGFDPARVASVPGAVGGIVRQVIRDLAGGPVRLVDKDGKVTAYRDGKKWLTPDGREVVPYDPEELRRLNGAGNKPLYDPATRQLLTGEGVPLTRTSTPRHQPPTFSSGRVSGALPPAWDTSFGPVR